MRQAFGQYLTFCEIFPRCDVTPCLRSLFSTVTANTKFSSIHQTCEYMANHTNTFDSDAPSSSTLTITMDVAAHILQA